MARAVLPTAEPEAWGGSTMDEQEALWSAQEVKTQAAQARGQVDIFEAIEDAETEHSETDQ